MSRDDREPETPPCIAVIGMAGRFPGARNVEELWRNLREGVESIAFFQDDEVEASELDPFLPGDPAFVKARGILEGAELFDADFFGYSPREAQVIDPQQRLFLECAWEALEDAGHVPGAGGARVGVYAGASMNRYFLNNLRGSSDVIGAVGILQTLIGNDKDYLPTRVSYKLNLRGPSINVQTACSTSLVAVHLACQALLNGECDMALAGGSTVRVPQKAGYLYQEGGMSSPDGHCRTFDARARGTVFSNGVGVVVLKRLEDALADGDAVRAVIRGSAVNNDGAAKVGFTAPGVDSQAEVVAEALAVAGVPPQTVTFVEAHGTGTEMGDPIEVAALTRAFRLGTDEKGFCALGSLKTNIGHLDAAAGVAGLIKVALALENREIPPSLFFEEPNPKLCLENSPFYVNASLAPWRVGAEPRRAGVSSLGVGGTNAHVVLEEAPPAEPGGPSRPWQLLTLSARDAAALERSTVRLVEHLRSHPGLDPADVAFTLHVGRKAFEHRRCVVVCSSLEEAVEALEQGDARRTSTGCAGDGAQVVFLFPGQGSQRPGMGADLYLTEAMFRAQLDLCAGLLQSHLGIDLRRVLFPSEGAAQEAAERLRRTDLAQPALFAVEYALARQWQEWGIPPAALAGHSVGEYVAACLAGVLSLRDALALVAARGRLMQQIPVGAMLAVPLGEEEVLPWLDGELSLAAVNGPARSVVAGPVESIQAVEHRLAGQGVLCRRLHTSHAFHSRMMDPILDRFRQRVEEVALDPPSIPFISNLTGTWITPQEATDPGYWTEQLRRTVRFGDGVAELLRDPTRVFLEVGPGQTLSTFVRQHPAGRGEPLVTSSLRLPHEEGSDLETVLAALGRLWTRGVAVDWPAFHTGERRRRVHLPAYPFEGRRHWVEPGPEGAGADASGPLLLRSWRRTASAAAAAAGTRWLVLEPRGSLAARLLERLRESGAETVTVAGGENPVAVARDLAGRGWMPDGVLHLAGLGDGGGEGLARRLGLGSLLGLARELCSPRLGFAIVTLSAQAVTGEEDVVPERAVLPALARVLVRELPGLACRSIDVAEPAGSCREGRLAGLLAAEICSPPVDPAVALRGSQRWVAAFEPVRNAPLAADAGEDLAAALARAGGTLFRVPTWDGPGLLALDPDGLGCWLGEVVRHLDETDAGEGPVVVEAPAGSLSGEGGPAALAGALAGALADQRDRAGDRPWRTVYRDLADPARPGLAPQAWRQALAALLSPVPLSPLVVAPSAPRCPVRLEPPAAEDEPLPDSGFAAPRTDLEKALAALWQEVLGVGRVGLDDNFFELGGDSILGLQVVARAGRQGIRLDPRQLFEHPTVAELAAVAGRGDVAAAPDLAPEQRRRLLEEGTGGQVRSFLLRPPRTVPLARLPAALLRLVERHEALRLRFVPDGTSGWRPVLAEPGGAPPFLHVDLSGLSSRAEAETLRAAGEVRRSVDATRGPLLRLALLQTGPAVSRLLLAVHPLAADEASCRLLAEDLWLVCETLEQRTDPAPVPEESSFRSWTGLLARRAAAPGLGEEARAWLIAAQREAARLPVSPRSGGAMRLRSVLEGEPARSVLEDLPAAFGVRPWEALLASVARVLATWGGEAPLRIEVEADGRTLDGHEAFARTVGPLAYRFPVLLEIPPAAPPAETLKTVKEQVRSLPGQGLSYALARHLADGALGRDLASLPQPEVLFCAWEADLTEPDFPEPRAEGPCGFQLEVRATAAPGRVEVEWTFGGALSSSATALLAGFEQALRDFAAQGASAMTRSYTPSDFPDADLDQEDLDQLIAELRELTE